MFPFGQNPKFKRTSAEEYTVFSNYFNAIFLLLGISNTKI